MATLDDLNDVLGSMRTSMVSQSNILSEMLKLQKEDRDNAKRKEEREKADRTVLPKKLPNPIEAEKVKSDTFANASNFGETLLGSFLGTATGAMGILGTITAGAAALSAAALGLRGWEVGAIKKISGLGASLSESVMRGVTNLRNSILIRYFGFTPENIPGRDPVTRRFVKGLTISEQIAQRIQTLKTVALSVFGLGPDGAPLMIRGANGKFVGKSIVGRITAAVSKLLSPLSAVADGVLGFSSGAGKSIFKFFEPFVKSAGSFAKFVGKILKPLGFILSAWEGVTVFMSTEGSIYEKFTAGIGAFFGDFIGAPLDLMKNAIAWIIGKLFGIESKDGKYDDSTVTGRVLNMVKEFSFEDVINSIVQAPFRWVGAVWDWVKLLFSDPKEALSSLWTGVVGGATSLGSLIWIGVEGAINWLVNKFGWSGEDENDQFDLSDYISEKWTQLSTYFSEKWTAVTTYIASIPERISLYVQDIWNNTKERMQLGFLELTDWIASIPKRLTAMIVNFLDKASFVIPSNTVNDFLGIAGTRFSLIDEDSVRQANEAVNAPNPDLEARRAAIIESAAAERARIEAAMGALETRALSASSGGNVVINAPTTVAPVTSVNNGGNSSSTLVYAGGGGRSDLDARSIPYGAQ